MAEKNGWTLFSTENGAVFNAAQLGQFDVVVWNNVSGKALSPEQRQVFRDWLEQGGAYVGIHASGDFSHRWHWYEQEVIGARYSHHTMWPQFQEGNLTLERDVEHPELSEGLPEFWTRTEEWYVFYDNPRDRGFSILYKINGNEIDPNGTIPILARNKDWGMGPDHPVAWYRTTGNSRIFYTSMGHHGSAYKEPYFLKMLENAIRWAGQFERN